MPIWIKHLFLLPLNCTEIVFILIQSYLILLHFTDTAVFYFFYKWKSSVRPALSKSVAIFPTAFAHFVSLAYLGNSCLIFVTVICNQWSLIFTQGLWTCWRLRWWSYIWSLYITVRYNAIVHIVHCIVST